MEITVKERKLNIIRAGQKAIDELIKIAEEPIVDSDEDITADRLKNAAATKKLAIFDALDILERIQNERAIIEAEDNANQIKFKGFSEDRRK
jgi:hypothetical protein